MFKKGNGPLLRDPRSGVSLRAGMMERPEGLGWLQANIQTSSVPTLLDVPEAADMDLIPGKYEGDTSHTSSIPYTAP